MQTKSAEPLRRLEMLDRARVCRQLAATATVQASSELRKLAARYEALASPQRASRSQA